MHNHCAFFFVWKKVPDSPSRVEDRIEESDRMSEVTDSAAEVMDRTTKEKDNPVQKKWKTPIICVKFRFVLC